MALIEDSIMCYGIPLPVLTPFKSSDLQTSSIFDFITNEGGYFGLESNMEDAYGPIEDDDKDADKNQNVDGVKASKNQNVDGVKANKNQKVGGVKASKNQFTSMNLRDNSISKHKINAFAALLNGARNHNGNKKTMNPNGLRKRVPSQYRVIRDGCYRMIRVEITPK